MLARAGVSSPNRCRKRTARASLWAKAWLPTTSRSATCAAVSPKTAALRLSQARAAAGASAGSSEVAAPSEPSAGRIGLGVPNWFQRTSTAPSRAAACRWPAEERGAAQVEVVEPRDRVGERGGGAAGGARRGVGREGRQLGESGDRAAVSRASAVAVSRPRRRGVGVMTVTTARSAVRYAPPSTGAKTGLRHSNSRVLLDRSKNQATVLSCERLDDSQSGPSSPRR